MTSSCLVPIVHIRVHATYTSPSYTAMKYGVMEAVLVVAEVARLRYGLVGFLALTIATFLSARCNLPSLLLLTILHARCAWHVAVALRAADEMCLSKILSRTVDGLVTGTD